MLFFFVVVCLFIPQIVKLNEKYKIQYSKLYVYCAETSEVFSLIFFVLLN